MIPMTLGVTVSGEYAQFECQVMDLAVRATKFDIGHDFQHLKRVRDMAVRCADSTGQDYDHEALLAAAWLHDVVNVAKDSPDRKNASRMSAELAEELIRDSKIDMTDCQIAIMRGAILSHSFSARIEPRTIVACAVRDADRLDSMGVIGFMRMVAVSVSMGRKLVAPADPLCTERKPNDHEYTIDHYFTKIMHLGKDMKTPLGKQLAAERLDQMATMIKNLGGELTGDGTSSIVSASYPIGV